MPYQADNLFDLLLFLESLESVSNTREEMRVGLTGIRSCTREAISCTIRRSNKIWAVLIRRSSSPALSCCINRMNDSFAMRCGIRGIRSQTLTFAHEPELTISIMQHSERQVKPCSLRAGSSLLRRDGTIKSETNPSNTALSRKVYITSNKQIYVKSLKDSTRTYTIDSLE
jgi:hypothetical protein